MTPLAHEIVKDSLLPVKRRQHGDVMQHLRLLDGVHFFECSAVFQTACDMINSRNWSSVRERLGFLPAPRTWLEFAIDREKVKRVGLLIEDSSDGYASTLGVAKTRTGEIQLFGNRYGFPLEGAGFSNRFKIYDIEKLSEKQKNEGNYYIKPFYGLLAMINTPRVIMRCQHMPHRGLERQLVAQRGNVGTWPLQGWSELVLKVRPPDIDDTDHEAHLTGARALHFCRSHLRIRLGRLELVSAHWRGDPALGIKQTRYRLAA